MTGIIGKLCYVMSEVIQLRYYSYGVKMSAYVFVCIMQILHISLVNRQAYLSVNHGLHVVAC